MDRFSYGQCTREIGVDAGGQAETQPGIACEHRTEDHVVYTIVRTRIIR